MFNYDIDEIQVHKVVDSDGTFIVYTAFLDLKKRDYSVLIEQEWKVSEALGLYDNNKILRFL